MNVLVHALPVFNTCYYTDLSTVAANMFTYDVNMVCGCLAGNMDDVDVMYDDGYEDDGTIMDVILIEYITFNNLFNMDWLNLLQVKEVT